MDPLNHFETIRNILETRKKRKKTNKLNSNIRAAQINLFRVNNQNNLKTQTALHYFILFFSIEK